MTDQQLAVLLDHIARGINIEAGVIAPLLHTPDSGEGDPLISLLGLADMLMAQAKRLRAGAGLLDP